MGKTITIEGFGLLFDNMLDSMKIEQLSERMSNLDGILMSIVTTISIIIFVLSLKQLVDLNAKVRALEKQITEIFKSGQKNLMDNKFQNWFIRIERNSPSFSDNQP